MKMNWLDQEELTKLTELASRGTISPEQNFRRLYLAVMKQALLCAPPFSA